LITAIDQVDKTSNDLFVNLDREISKIAVVSIVIERRHLILNKAFSPVQPENKNSYLFIPNTLLPIVI